MSVGIRKGHYQGRCIQFSGKAVQQILVPPGLSPWANCWIRWPCGVCSTVFLRFRIMQLTARLCCQENIHVELFPVCRGQQHLPKQSFIKLQLTTGPLCQGNLNIRIFFHMKKQQEFNTAIAKYHKSWNESICFFHTFPLLCFNLSQPTWSVFTQIRSVTSIKL